MPKICKADNCDHPVFSHGYCRNHTWMWKKPTPLKRTAIKQSSKPVNKLDNMSSKRGGKLDNDAKGITLKVKSKKRIKQSSTKRSKENALYEQAKANVREMLQEEGNWKCFFSCLVLPDEFNEFHHLMDKHGDLLSDTQNIRPAIRIFHNDYHQKSISFLIEQKWYRDFLVRIEEDFPEVYEKEMRRINKSGIGVRAIAHALAKPINLDDIDIRESLGKLFSK